MKIVQYEKKFQFISENCCLEHSLDRLLYQDVGIMRYCDNA